MGFYDFVHTAPAPSAKRQENAFEMTGQKRFSHNWQFLASVVFSKLEGNYDGTFQTRPASSIRTSTPRSTTPTSWSTPTAS